MGNPDEPRRRTGPAPPCRRRASPPWSLPAPGPREGRATALAALLAALLLGPDGPAHGGARDVGAVAQGEDDRQTAFRVRRAFDAPLNDPQGWAAGVDEPAIVQADAPFRLRFEVVAGRRGKEPRRFGLQVRRNGGAWTTLPAEDFPYPLKVHALPPATPTPAGAAAGTADRVWRVVQGEARGLAATRSDGAHWRAQAGEAPLLALGRTSMPWTPTELALELRLHPGQRAGVVFAYADGGHHARIELIAPDRLRLVYVDAGEAVVLTETRTPPLPGRWRALEIALAGGEVGVELDGAVLVPPRPLPAGAGPPRLGIHLPAGHAAEFRALVLETEASTPPTSIVSAGSFAHGARTEDLLPVAERPFTGGAGVSLAPRTPPWEPRDGHGEWSFPIVIRRFTDEAAMNEEGDRFDYRLTDALGAPLPTDALATVSLAVPPGHVGGTFVETPMRIGPWQAANGDLYFIMEPAETWNRLMMVRSTDGGRTWREVDGAARPATGDLEGLGSTLADGRIHILHQVSEAVFYHSFDTAGGSADEIGWTVRDEPVAAPPQPPTQVADLAVRADGSVVAVYGAGRGLRYRVRAPGGGWGAERAIDAGGDLPDDTVLSGPTVVLGREEVVHLAYTAGDGSAWYRRIGPDDALSTPVRIASDLGTTEEDVGAILPLLYLEESETVAVLYRNRKGRLVERRLDAAGRWSQPGHVTDRPVVQNAVDSDQVAADAVAHGETIHVLYVEEGTGRLFHAAGRQGTWREYGAVVTDADVQWVRGTLLETPEGKAYGFVYDAGSDGGSGMNRFGRVVLP